MGIDAIEELADALDSGEDAKILDAFLSVEDSIKAERRSEQRFDLLANALRYTTEHGTDGFETGGVYLDSMVTLDDKRETLSLATFEYLAGAGSITDAQEAVLATTDAYETSEQRRNSLEAAAAEAAVPPVLAFDGVDDVTVPVGSKRTVDVLLTNLGTSASRGVELEVTGMFASAVDPTEVDSLGARESTIVTVTVTPEEADSAIVTVAASTERAGDDVSFGVDALDTSGFIKRASRSVSGMVDFVDAHQSGNQGGPSLRRQLTRVGEKLDQAVDTLDRDAPEESIDGKLDAAANQLALIRNRLENEAGTGLSPVAMVELIEEIATTLENVQHAINST